MRFFTHTGPHLCGGVAGVASVQSRFKSSCVDLSLTIFEPGTISGDSNSANGELNKTSRYIYRCVAYDEKNEKLKYRDIVHPFHRDI